MNILLHICCAPCSIYPLAELKKKAHRVAGYYYNPNIHPYSEYLKRKSFVDRYSKESGLNVIAGDYEIEKYFEYTVSNETRPNRCPVCWWMRIERAALAAKENAFEAFTTTLLGSPYQDHAAIKVIAQDVAEKTGVKFYYEDFRVGFRDAMTKARTDGMYCQNYCGCVFSERERLDKTDRPAKAKKAKT